jgi:hypothetical protein
MVPKVSISSVVMPLREDDAWLPEVRSIEGVGVNVLLEEEDDDDDPDERLKCRKKGRPLDFCQDEGGAVPVDDDLSGGRVGGRQIGTDAGDAGSEPEASLLVVFVIDAGVVVPDADDGSVESLLRLEEDPKLLTLDVS